MFKPEEWSQQHEQAFKSIMRKSHSVNSLAKTRRFRELERNLPPDKTNIDKNWRYDLNSPWVNDLDLHDAEYYSFNLDSPKTPKRPKHISNIRMSTREEPPEIDPEAALEQERRRLTGLTGSVSEHTLRSKADLVTGLHRFEDAKKGYELIYQWEKSKTLLEKDSATLAEHLIKDLHGDMKQLSKARYAYLSAKIAKQRSSAQLTKKMLVEAENKRKELRKRQEELMRDVAKARSRLAKMYGRSYLQARRRVIANTAHPIGSPQFLKDMVALGFLPRHWSPQPQKPKAEPTQPAVPPQYTYASQRNLSKLTTHEVPEKPSSSRWELEKKRERAAQLIQRWFKGAKVRKETGLYLRAIARIQRWYKRRKQRRAVLRYLARQQTLQPRKIVQKVLNEFNGIPSFPSSPHVSVKKTVSTPVQSADEAHYIPSYAECKALQMTTKTEKLVVRPKTQPPIPKPPPSITGLPRKTLPGARTPHTPNYHVYKFTSTLSPDEAAVILHRINDLRTAVLTARFDMWRFFLNNVSGKTVSEEDLAGLLAKDSLYVRRKVKEGGEVMTWEGSELRLNLNEPLTELDLRKIPPQTV